MRGQYKLNPLGENLETRKMLADASKSEIIYQGDAVTIEADGYVIKARGHVTPASALSIAGVAQGFYYSSGSQEQAFPNDLAAAEAGEISVIIDPMATFAITGNGGADTTLSITQAMIGSGVNLVTTGNQQLDMDTLDTSTNSRQLKIIGREVDAAGTIWAIVRIVKHALNSDVRNV